MRGALEALGAPAEKIVVNPYGPHEAFYEVHSRPESDLVLAVGRFVPKKGPLHTLRAFASVADARPEARLVMAGDGPLRDMTQALAGELGVEDRVSFPGAVSHPEVRQLMGNATVFVQHSLVDDLGDSEGTPVAILEAQAAGLPIVSTRHAGIPEAVLHETTGFLVEEGDTKAMGRALGRLLDEPELARRMGEAGRRHVSENYSLTQHISLLDRVLAEAAGRTYV
jgi:glycosyltransferase involved in cell wall biosynthesis